MSKGFTRTSQKKAQPQISGGLFPTIDPQVMKAARAAVEAGVPANLAQELALSNPAKVLKLQKAIENGLHPAGVSKWLDEVEYRETLEAAEYGWFTGLVFARAKVLTSDTSGLGLISKAQEWGGDVTLDFDDEMLQGEEACEFVKELKQVNPDMDLEFVLDERTADEIDTQREQLGGACLVTFALTAPTLLKEVHKQFPMKFKVADLYPNPVYIGKDGDLTTDPSEAEEAAKPLSSKHFARKGMYTDPKGQLTPLAVGSEGPNEPYYIGRVSVTGELVDVRTGIQTKSKGTKEAIRARFKRAQKITEQAIVTSRAQRAAERATEAEIEDDDTATGEVKPLPQPQADPVG